MGTESPERSAGQKKVDEYIDRIRGGEEKEVIFEGLPESFKAGIEKGLMESESEEHHVEKQTPDTEASHQLEALRNKLGMTPSQEKMKDVLSVEERKKMSGWQASYELAKIAQREHVDLAIFSREEYANFAISNALSIDDAQLRAAPWQRVATSAEEVLQANREHRARIKEEVENKFARFSHEVMQKAATENRSMTEGIRVRQGTKDSNSWLYFGINQGTSESTKETYKSYLSFKDINAITPERFTGFMEALRDAHYNGDIKIFQDLSEQGIQLGDQVVMHGNSKEDAILALQVAESFFNKDLEQKSLGKDEVVDGEMKSYSQVLAGRIAEAVRNI